MSDKAQIIEIIRDLIADGVLVQVGSDPILNLAQMAAHLGKSTNWVQERITLSMRRKSIVTPATLRALGIHKRIPP